MTLVGSDMVLQGTRPLADRKEAADFRRSGIFVELQLRKLSGSSAVHALCLLRPTVLYLVVINAVNVCEIPADASGVQDDRALDRIRMPIGGVVIDVVILRVISCLRNAVKGGKVRHSQDGKCSLSAG